MLVCFVFSVSTDDTLGSIDCTYISVSGDVFIIVSVISAILSRMYSAVALLENKSYAPA
ncbi:hypothetical protein SDC9_137529 [bioreactor metagenome]|uniref:Uncharacterized protein n=1 Tax=bioreactor metagenome TaxID=1076179 RepID=A0A645DMT2_9ZZZZ